MILKRAERLTEEERKQASPFHYGELLVYPNLGEAVSKSAMKQLPFFFNVYVAKGTTAAPRMTIEVLQGGKPLAQMPASLPAPDAQGRIQFASSIPLESFQPGDYELRITIIDGSTSIPRIVPFAVAQ